jgi:pyridinium-3,5-bisthiocarboxylic acid mononucleotide nickel chelatase
MAAHLHLDAVGGVAGDMLVAALLDLFGEPEQTLEAIVPMVRSAGLHDDVTLALLTHSDDVFAGRRFVVVDPREQAALKRGPGRFVFSSSSASSAGHVHVPLARILANIEASALTAGAKARAIDIFSRIGAAEGSVHGVPFADVALHEVGSQDSIADVVTAAILLDRLVGTHGGLVASVSSLPLGSGRVQTAHGELPVPAPATLALLVGFATHDDGRPGERVTPTGAGLVAHLCAGQSMRRPPGIIQRVGIGFGTRTFVGLSNIVRATLSLPAAVATTSGPRSATAPSWTTRTLAQLGCDIDDMTAEELAHAAAALRDVDGVLDVHLVPVIMKKGRPGTTMVVVCDESARDAAAAALFSSTTTLGLRCTLVERLELARTEARVGAVRVKTAQRPTGATHKADHDDVAGDTLAARRAARAQAESDVAGRRGAAGDTAEDTAGDAAGDTNG